MTERRQRAGDERCRSMSVRLAVAAVVQRTAGSMRHAPSPSSPRASSSAWLACRPDARASRRAAAALPAIDSRTSARSSWSESCRPTMSTRSMMPTIAASTGARLPAQRLAGGAPLEHDQHLLVHAGADAVHRQQRRPRGVSSTSAAARAAAWRPRTCGASAWTTTVPMTRAICMSSLDVPVVDDADDAGVDRRLDGIERKARFLAADEEHLFADAGAHGVDRDERPAGRLALGRQRLHDEQLEARRGARPCGWRRRRR